MATVTLKRDQPTLSPKDENTILEVMHAMLASAHFAKSKRYPALLDYCVRNTLKGDLYALKERVIGSEVFGRPVNYDSSEDPVVRIAAGEVRKRIALYFDEHRDSLVRIDLPLGTYTCTFHFQNEENSIVVATSRAHRSASLSHNDLPPIAPLSDATNRRNYWTARKSILLVSGAVICLMTLLLGTWTYLSDAQNRDIWRPVLQRKEPAIILVGQGSQPVQDVAPTKAEPATLATEARRARNQVEMANAIAAANICGEFQRYSRPCEIIPARTAAPKDLFQKTVVLVGGFDNPWTERLLASLRFKLERIPSSDYPTGKLLSIADRDRKANGAPWMIDRGISPDQMQSDYLVIARFRNDATDGDVLVAAGIWTVGTQVAGEYITSPEKMAQITSLAPAGWGGFNFEAVLQTDVINGASGNVRVLAAEFW